MLDEMHKPDEELPNDEGDADPLDVDEGHIG
jgi:hypothetical protein